MLGAKSSGGGETVKRKMSPSKKCHHFDIGSPLAFLHRCTRDSHFKCQQAHRSQGGGVGVREGWFDQAAGDHSSLPPLRSSPPHLSSTERGNKSDRVQSLSLICQWGEWAGKRLSDRPAVACPPCQLYWIMTRQEVACYEPRGGRRRRRREISRAWFFPTWGDGAEKQPKWNLSVCKAHDVFYEVMGFEKILDRLWWKDELLPGVRWCYTSCNRCIEGSRLRYET